MITVLELSQSYHDVTNYLVLFLLLLSMSALHQAALVGNGDVLNALIEHGAAVDIADSKSEFRFYCNERK